MLAPEGSSNCGSIEYKAELDATSEYDPWSNSQVEVTDAIVGNDLTFYNLDNWVFPSGATNLLVKGFFKVKVAGKDWIPQFETPFSIKIYDCTRATLTTPSGFESSQTI